MGVRVLAPADQARQFVVVVPLLRSDQLLGFLDGGVPRRDCARNLMLFRKTRNPNQHIFQRICIQPSRAMAGGLDHLQEFTLLGQETVRKKFWRYIFIGDQAFEVLVYG